MANDAANGNQAAEDLLARIARRDESALKSLYDQVEARVYRYAYSRLNDSFAAADVLNEVMLEVWQHAGRFAGRSKVSTWILGIARHKVIDYMRRERRHAAEAYDTEIADEDTPAAADAIAGLQDADRLRQCLEKLSDVHREAVHLAFFEHLSYAEIGEISGCPEGTVKTRIYHARAALKRCLGRS